MSDLLEDEDLTAALKKCPEWEHEKKSITRTVEFEEFMEVISPWEREHLLLHV